jgi:hypothetical protein
MKKNSHLTDTKSQQAFNFFPQLLPFLGQTAKILAPLQGVVPADANTKGFLVVYFFSDPAGISRIVGVNKIRVFGANEGFFIAICIVVHQRATKIILVDQQISISVGSATVKVKFCSLPLLPFLDVPEGD